MSDEIAYPGARPFGREDSGRFFGRAGEAGELSSLWLQHRLTFLSGPAGVGKTSLLAAGVLPLVNRANVDLLPIGGFSRGSSSPAAPPGQHTPYTLALLRSWSSGGTVPELSPFTVDEFIARRVKRRDPAVGVLAVIDQADDLYAGPQDRQPQRLRFLRELVDALRHPSLHLLICVRDHALLRFTEVLGPGAHFPLHALEPDQAYRAVEGPGFFDPQAARDLVESIRTTRIMALGVPPREVVAARVEPSLLQVVCARLWERLRERFRMMSPRELRRHGNIDAVLSAHCGAAISATAELHDIPVSLLRSWLISTFVAASGGCQDIIENPTEIAGQPGTVARKLEDYHLLRARTEQSAGARIYRLITDRIIEPLRHAPDDCRPDGAPDDYLLAAERALTAGEARLAERYAELARKAAPETDLLLHGSARSLLGNLARDNGEPTLAVEHYRAAVSLFEAAMQHAMVALLLAAIARALIACGELEAGIRELHAAVRRRPADTTIQAEFSAAVQELTWRLTYGGGPPRVSLG